MSNQIKQKIFEDLKKARGHLEYSYKKVKQIPFNNPFTEEQLETLESFGSRFSRFSDIAIAQYFRYLAKENDPAFRGSVIDTLAQAEKFGWINSAEAWRRIRELRNLAAHEYSAEDYKELYQELVEKAPILLELKLG